MHCKRTVFVLFILACVWAAPVGAQAIVKHLAPSGMTAEQLANARFSVSEMQDMRMRARTGDTEAQYRLGAMEYMRGNYPQAQSWYRRAALLGHHPAQFNLGLMYYRGEGTDQDFNQAHRWISRSAESGVAEAQFQMGIMHYRGRGVPVDPQREAYWYERAASNGHAESQYNLAVLYSKGHGVEADLVKAYAWLDAAVANGVEAADQLAGLREELNPEQLRRAQDLRLRIQSREYAKSLGRADAG